MAASNDIVGPVTERISSSGITTSQFEQYLDIPINSADTALQTLRDFVNKPLVSIPGVTTPSPVNQNGVKTPAKSANGKEKNPPAPNKGQTGTVPQKGQADIATTARSVTTKNGISYTNGKLVHVCDFTIQLDLEVCKKKFEIISVNEVLRATSLGTWAASVHFPFIDQIRSLYNTLKGWYDMIKDWVNQIKEWIDCLKSIISAVQTVVSFIVNLPSSVLSQVFNCIAGFEKLFTDALTSTLDAISVDISSSNATDDVSAQMTDASDRESAATNKADAASKK